ncbi:membrane bound O-acyl transferase family-domain-containing protein, partial [Desarmillaria tabescens]
AGFALLCYKGLQYTTGDKLQNYSMGSTIGGQFFTALHLLLIVEPIRQYRHLTDIDDPRTRPLLKRVYWAGCIIHSPRGIGWNYQTPHDPDRPTMKRGSFIISRVLQRVNYISRIFIPLPKIVAWMSTPYAGVRIQYYFISAISVALGLSTAADWPDPYGRWSDAYTVRKFWGRTWHQMMRRMGAFCYSCKQILNNEQYLSPIGKVVVQASGFEKGTWISSFTQLSVGFFVSGAMHSFGDAMVGRKHFGASFPFFIVQVVAIVAEDFVIDLTGRLGKRPSTKVSYIISFAWVFSWSVISFPLYIDWAVRAGLGSCEILPVSPIRAALGLWK